MSQTCQRCYRVVMRACQNDTESLDCINLRPPDRQAVQYREDVRKLEKPPGAVQSATASSTKRKDRTQLKPSTEGLPGAILHRSRGITK